MIALRPARPGTSLAWGHLFQPPLAAPSSAESPSPPPATPRHPSLYHSPPKLQLGGCKQGGEEHASRAGGRRGEDWGEFAPKWGLCLVALQGMLRLSPWQGVPGRCPCPQVSRAIAASPFSNLSHPKGCGQAEEMGCKDLVGFPGKCQALSLGMTSPSPSPRTSWGHPQGSSQARKAPGALQDTKVTRKQ